MARTLALTGDAAPPDWNGYLLTAACPCDVAFERWVTPEGGARELVLTPMLALPS